MRLAPSEDSGVDVDGGVLARSLSDLEQGENEVFLARAVVNTTATATAATEAAAAVKSPYVGLDSVMSCGTAPTALTPVMSPVTGYVIAICGDNSRGPAPLPPPPPPHDQPAHVPVSRRPDADQSSRRDAEVASRRDPCSVVSARDEYGSRSGRLDTVARQSQHGDPPPPPPPPSAAEPHFAGSDYIPLDQLHSNRVLDDSPPLNDSAM